MIQQLGMHIMEYRILQYLNKILKIFFENLDLK